MFKIFNSTGNAKTIEKYQKKDFCQEPKMSIKKWYALQQKLREEQMAQARVGK